MKKLLTATMGVLALGWLAAPGASGNDSHKPLFDGKSLKGWEVLEGEGQLWRVEDGAITAGSLTEKVPHNSFLASEQSFHNFELRLKIRITGTEGFVNSGIQIRSVRIPGNHEMIGYQADAGKGWWGKLYDESRRRKVIGELIDAEAVRRAVKPDGWNDYRIRAEGKRIRSWINGVAALDYTEAEANIPQDGRIGLQVHGNGKTVVQFKDVTIETLPPTPNAPTWEKVGLPKGKKKKGGKALAERKGIALHPHVGQHLDLLEIWIKARMAYAGLPGLSIGIVENQELIYAKGFGHSNLETKTPTTPDTLYRIASHSKLFAAISILQLRDRGKLKLDDPVKQHLSDFNITISHPEAHSITIRHLLTHSSGLPREAGSAYWLDFKFPDRKEIFERLKRQKTVLPSDSLFKYSNLAYALLGEIIERKAGQTFAEYVEGEIMAPLGMAGSSVVFSDGQKAKLATGYGRRMPDGSREAFPFVDARGMAAATGVTSSVNDMAKFVSWQLRLRKSGGRELLAQRTLKEMQRPHWVVGDWKHARGLGFDITHTDARELIGHGGGYPGYRTSTNISSRENIGVIVFANSLDSDVYPGSAWSVTDRIFDWIVPAINEAAENDTSQPIRPEWKTLVGTYQMPWEDSHILFLDGAMAIINPNTPNPKKSLIPLEHISGTTFRINRQFRGFDFGSVGETVSFEFAPNRKVKRVKIGVLYADPIEF